MIFHILWPTFGWKTRFWVKKHLEFIIFHLFSFRFGEEDSYNRSFTQLHNFHWIIHSHCSRLKNSLRGPIATAAQPPPPLRIFISIQLAWSFQFPTCYFISVLSFWIILENFDLDVWEIYLLFIQFMLFIFIVSLSFHFNSDYNYGGLIWEFVIWIQWWTLEHWFWGFSIFSACFVNYFLIYVNS